MNKLKISIYYVKYLLSTHVLGEVKTQPRKPKFLRNTFFTFEITEMTANETSLFLS